MKLSQGLVVLGVVLIGALLFGAYSAASAPLPEGFPKPTSDGQIEINSDLAPFSIGGCAVGQNLKKRA